jgi:hypothetical protein
MAGSRSVIDSTAYFGIRLVNLPEHNNGLARHQV